MCRGIWDYEQTSAGLFLLWAGSPLSVATAAIYVMFSCSVPKHAPSKVIDGKIILGGMEGWEVKASTQEN